MKLKLPKLPKIPQFPRLIFPLARHKFVTMASFSAAVFLILAMWYRNKLVSEMKLAQADTVVGSVLSATVVPDTPTPREISPVPTEKTKEVLGASAYKAPDVYIPPYVSPTPYPTLPPLPTFAPAPAINPYFNNNSNSSNNSNTGNPNCNTGSGIPNSWYSDVYPNPPISTNTGSVQIVVTLRDCSVQTAPVNDTLKISLSSGDPNTKINGNSLPYTVTASNGSAGFEVSSLVAGTVALVVEDTSRSFTVTDINNHSPVITFSGSGSANSPANPNCTTGTGVANAWYSDVYPASPVSANTGANAVFSVVIRDCSKNNVTSTENLAISQTSNDPGLTVNGSSLPANIQASNGQVSFNVSSPNAGTVTLTIRDTSNSFNITDTGNHNPSVVFGGSSATNAPTATAAPGPTNTPAPNPTNTPFVQPSSTPAPPPSATSTPAPTASNSPSPNPTPAPTTHP